MSTEAETLYGTPRPPSVTFPVPITSNVTSAKEVPRAPTVEVRLAKTVLIDSSWVALRAREVEPFKSPGSDLIVSNTERDAIKGPLAGQCGECERREVGHWNPCFC